MKTWFYLFKMQRNRRLCSDQCAGMVDIQPALLNVTVQSARSLRVLSVGSCMFSVET